MGGKDVGAVKVYRDVIRSLLEKAAASKDAPSIEPPVTEASLGGVVEHVLTGEDGISAGINQQTQYAAVETAFREIFYDLLATTSINEPSFMRIWNLLDIVSIFSDNEKCEPGLIFWLIEELLDSQTIDGCRKVFDYLESRRERNTAKHFKQKSLIILRSCNELLRRLSRAEDTVFCGRVFIFLFQSFPLGDKSSVNLRGEYHTENVTTFDIQPKIQAEGEEAMDIDIQGDVTPASNAKDSQQEPTITQAPLEVTNDISSQRTKEPEIQLELDLDTLYAAFWGLQESFSKPTRLFDAAHFASLKSGLEATLSSFRKVSSKVEVRNTTKGLDESRRGTKRKRAEGGSDLPNSFNPKYLTSRDLFELEINDVSFRRHILVQALILLDFLLSLTPKSKAKLADSTNKSVLYGYVLSDEDAKWATQMRSSIASYLQKGADGKFYFRMVDTVLTRDKNWVRWKAEGCPPIERPPVPVQSHLDTQSSAVKITANRRLRSTPMGSLDLGFLAAESNLGDLDRLKEPERFATPSLDFYMSGITDDDFNIDMAKDDDEKEQSVKAKASKTWRTLRIASRSRLNQLDKIEDGKNLKVLLEPTPAPNSTSAKSQPDTDNSADVSKEDETKGSNVDTTGPGQPQPTQT
ncbi:THO complex subunit 1 [Nannizzia gypsea CBS 118893]|uniref:THO complex subunit 1 n=1 Tax=Arthroderma gypseum (strain ATCC MYA-4604 / CBS 118893) TaxID=535722 RepID=E4V2S7_ARTGP|nr:THO complex subunit 1 [Nannizzia gypsea CBS 118893]EFR04301.1 THO complex subunit 1 [Nannizzia gypsea CBS 118893]